MNDKRPLRSALKTLLQQEQLSEQELVRLQALKTGAASKTHAGRVWSVAAAVTATALLLGILFRLDVFSATSLPLPESIAHEVLVNHLKIHRLDVSTDSIDKVRRELDRLDFSPFLSTRIYTSGYRLLGARYCTLQGVIALQMRLENAEGASITYYQALYDPGRFGKLPDTLKNEPPKRVIEHGFEMLVWQENGVASVLAQPVL